MLATSETGGTTIQLSRPPVTKEELWWVVYALWGVKLPRVQVCPDHVSPFDAFAEAYFGNRYSWVLWYGSRGTGKSYMLALLAMTKAALLEINVVLLGGSMAQSNNIHEHVESLLLYKNAPRQAVANQIKTELGLYAGNWIRPLPASQKTVRGPHPHMTLLDEIDEMEIGIYNAAMGQAMTKPNMREQIVEEMVVASSTWQNPIGTFQEVKDDAERKGLPVRTWCFREVLAPNGWMDPQFIERKRKSVPAEMFRVEYELGEPAGGSRAFDLERLNKAFVPMKTVRERHAQDDDEWVYEEYNARGEYAAGADWAKEQDKTVITVTRLDVKPHRTVYHRRINRRPWPVMIGYFNDAVNLYQARSAHDATGVGNVVNDYIDERSNKVVMIGQKRIELINEFITDVEQGIYQFPRPDPEAKLGEANPMFAMFKSTTVADVYSTTASAHLPDDVVAGAMMRRAHDRQAATAGPQGAGADERGSKVYADLQKTPDLDKVMGEVAMADEQDLDVQQFWL